MNPTALTLCAVGAFLYLLDRQHREEKARKKAQLRDIAFSLLRRLIGMIPEG